MITLKSNSGRKTVFCTMMVIFCNWLTVIRTKDQQIKLFNNVDKNVALRVLLKNFSDPFNENLNFSTCKNCKTSCIHLLWDGGEACFHLKRLMRLANRGVTDASLLAYCELIEVRTVPSGEKGLYVCRGAVKRFLKTLNQKSASFGHIQKICVPCYSQYPLV